MDIPVLHQLLIFVDILLIYSCIPMLQFAGLNAARLYSGMFKDNS